MSAAIRNAATNADRIVPIMAVRMSIAPGAYQKPDENAPAAPARTIMNLFTGRA